MEQNKPAPKGTYTPPILDKSPELSEEDLEVIFLFLDGMPRRTAYRKVYKHKISDGTIYNWWRLPKVQNKLEEYQKSLDDYNVIGDKILIDIITNPNSRDGDKIKAIKLMGDLRNRIKTTIKLETEKFVKLDNISDEDLEQIITLVNNGKQ